MKKARTTPVGNDASRRVVIKAIVEAIAWVLAANETDIPKPVIRALVTAAVHVASQIDPAQVLIVMRRLGAPSLVAEVIERLRFAGIRIGKRESCDLVCPVTERSVLFKDGDGTYECPFCDADIEVTGGVPVHPLPVEVDCPVTDDSIEMKHGDGLYDCPYCGADISVTDGKAEHEELPSVTCPSSHDIIFITEGTGIYACPDCDEEIVVLRARARHG